MFNCEDTKYKLRKMHLTFNVSYQKYNRDYNLKENLCVRSTYVVFANRRNYGL